MNKFIAQLDQKVAAKQAIVDAYIAETGMTVEQIQAESKLQMDIFNKVLTNGEVSEEDKAIMNDPVLGRSMEASSAIDCIESYSETYAIADQLFEFEAKFLLTDGELLSPAGFHTSENVFFLKGATQAIQMDRLPKSSNLHYYTKARVLRKGA